MDPPILLRSPPNLPWAHSPYLRPPLPADNRLLRFRNQIWRCQRPGNKRTGNNEPRKSGISEENPGLLFRVWRAPVLAATHRRLGVPRRPPQIYPPPFVHPCYRRKGPSPGLGLVKIDFLLGTKWGFNAGRRQKSPTPALEISLSERRIKTLPISPYSSKTWR